MRLLLYTRKLSQHNHSFKLRLLTSKRHLFNNKKKSIRNSIIELLIMESS